jgi:membrane protein implicated in regulation of membrane protease activity
LTLGLLLLGLELLTGTFVMLFFGIAFVLVGGSGFLVEWTSGEMQILSAMLLGGILTFALRRFLMQGMGTENLPLETMQVGETGMIVENDGHLRLDYKGTTWGFKQNGEFTVKAGDEVVVEKLKNNVAYIQKLP